MRGARLLVAQLIDGDAHDAVDDVQPVDVHAVDRAEDVLVVRRRADFLGRQVEVEEEEVGDER